MNDTTIKQTVAPKTSPKSSTDKKIDKKVVTADSRKAASATHKQWAGSVTVMKRQLRDVMRQARANVNLTLIKQGLAWFKADMVAKGLALFIACLLWFVVRTLPNSITQRTLTLPLNVEGLAEGELGRGIPDSIEVSISGPSERINSLKLEQIRASLSLAEAMGEFRLPIEVVPPRDVTVLRTIPQEVAGRVEIRQHRDMLVQPRLLHEITGKRVYASAAPAQVTIFGYDDAIDEVAWVAAFITNEKQVLAGNVPVEATVQALDATGAILPDIDIVPKTVEVTVKTQASVEVKNVAVKLDLHHMPSHLQSNYAQASHTLVLLGADSDAGIARMLELEHINASIDLSDYEAGVYNHLALTTDLPEGVLLLSGALSLDLELHDIGSKEDAIEARDTRFIP